MNQKVAIAAVLGAVLAASTVGIMSASAGARAGKSTPALATVGYVDFKRAVDECDDGKRANAEMQTELAPRIKKVEEMRAEIAKAEKSKEKPDALKARREKLDQFTKSAQAELDQKQQQRTAAIVDKMKKVIASVAESKGMSAVMPLGVYASAESDVTDAAIARYNAGASPKVSKDDEIARLKAQLAALEKSK